MSMYHQLTDEALLKHVADSDMDAAKFIYDKYAPAIYGIIVQKAGNRKVGEEILISTFILFFKTSCNKPSVLRQRIFISLYQIMLRSVKLSDGLYISHKSKKEESDIYSIRKKWG